MTGWLIDTNVLSALAPGKPTPPEGFTAWLRERTDALFLPVIAAMEIEAGIVSLRRRTAISRADGLQSWLDRILDQYGERVLAFDLAAARVAGSLSDAAQAAGRHPGLADIAVAAIARSRGLIVLTRNLRHFEPLGVETLNPFAAN